MGISKLLKPEEERVQNPPTPKTEAQLRERFESHAPQEKSFSFTKEAFVNGLLDVIPFSKWSKKYSAIAATGDALAGVTEGVMQIPQSKI